MTPFDDGHGLESAVLQPGQSRPHQATEHIPVGRVGGTGDLQHHLGRRPPVSIATATRTVGC
jgi:hypothetical protein